MMISFFEGVKQDFTHMTSCSMPIPTMRPARAPIAKLGTKRPAGICNRRHKSTASNVVALCGNTFTDLKKQDTNFLRGLLFLSGF